MITPPQSRTKLHHNPFPLVVISSVALYNISNAKSEVAKRQRVVYRFDDEAIPGPDNPSGGKRRGRRWRNLLNWTPEIVDRRRY